MINERTESITIGILADVDAGKTTLSESILYKSGILDSPGYVHKGETLLDNDEIEKRRGITIFSSQAVFQWKNRLFYLLDTPGHRDFSGETGKILQILDAAVLVISGTEGVTGMTLRLWENLKKMDIPVFIFVNKEDMPGFREDIFEEIENLLSSNAILFPKAMDMEKIGEPAAELRDFYEKLALVDEHVFTKFLENESLQKEEIAELVSNRSIFPVFIGSALKQRGTESLLNGISDFVNGSSYFSDFGARVFKISRDEKGGRLTHVKITGGRIRLKDSINGEKVEEIRIYSGSNFENVAEVSSGTVCSLVGLEKTYTGQGIGCEKERKISNIGGTLLYNGKVEKKDNLLFVNVMREISQEFPELAIKENNIGNSITLSFKGAVQRETIREILYNRYKLNVEFARVNLPLKETITVFAEDTAFPDYPDSIPNFQVLVEPSKNKSNVEIEVSLREEQLSSESQKELEETLKEAVLAGEIHGVLMEYPLDKMHITITGGRGKLRHRYQGDLFESIHTAIIRAIIKGKPEILYPFTDYQVQVESQDTGKITSLLKSRGAYIANQRNISNYTIIQGKIPLFEAYDFDETIMETTSGTGFFTVEDNISYEHLSGQTAKENKVEFNPENYQWVYEKVPSPEEEKIENKSSNFSGKDQLKAIFEMTYGKKKDRGREERIIKAKGKDDNYRGSNKGINSTKPAVLFVDGYNIIFAWPELKELSKTNLGAARDRLTEILANYAGYTGEKIVIVFDAYKQKDKVETKETIHGINIIYTREGETADHYIEKTVHDNIDKMPITVATSDRLEQMNVFSKGAMRLSATDLKKKVQSVTENMK